MAKIGIFPKKIGVNMRKYLRPSPRKKTPAPPCFFPVSAWDFGLKLTQLWKNPDNFLKVGKGWDWRWNYVEHIETLLVQSMVNCWFGYSWSPLYERDCAGVSLENHPNHLPKPTIHHYIWLAVVKTKLHPDFPVGKKEASVSRYSDILRNVFTPWLCERPWFTKKSHVLKS